MTDSAPILERSAVEPFLKNGYLLACPKTQQAAYIDPGAEATLILEKLEELDLQLQAILCTHAHLDHICGIGEVRNRWKAPIWLHPQDLPLYNALEEQARWFGLNIPAAPAVDFYFENGQEFELGRLRLEVILTPGHSPGSVSLLCQRRLFCGDVIFAGSVGRTDLPGGSHTVLIESIRRRILPLGDDVVLLPGHGPETNVGKERLSNPFLNASPFLVND